MAQVRDSSNDLHETTVLVIDGVPVDGTTPLPVTLGGDSITITGSVNVGTTVEISNNEGAPIPINGTVTVVNTHEEALHAHIDEIGSIDLSGTALPIDGVVDVDEFGGIDITGSTLPVSGTVEVSNFPATQTVDGTVELGATSLSALENINATVTGVVTVDSITNAVTIQDGGNSITVDGSVSATVSGTVSVDNFPATQTVDGTVNIGTMPEVSISTSTPMHVVGTTINPWGKAVLTVDDDTVQHTSHNRRKVSTYEITDFATFPFSKNENDFDEQITGTASSTHQPYLGMVQLSVGGSAGDQVVRQTRRVQRYLPGRGNEASMAIILNNTSAGIRSRFGVFDQYNGAYFEHDGTDYNVVIRRNTASGIVEERIARSNWNQDKLDGTGPSGIIGDPTAIQMLVIEYEWYGAGQVDFKFVINNNAHSVHQVNHANIHDHTWASYGSFPIRYELTNVTGAPGTYTVLHGSHSFLTEGTTTLLGKQLSISSPTTGYNLATAETFYPVLAIRLKSTALNSVVIPDEYAAGLLDKTDMFVRVIERPTTVTGGTWISVGPESPLEYNLTATSYTGGTIASTKFISEKQMGESITFPERAITQLGRKTTTVIGDTSEVFLIAAAATDNNKDAWVSLGWIEVR
jgi:hypothetical protein